MTFKRSPGGEVCSHHRRATEAAPTERSWRSRSPKLCSNPGNTCWRLAKWKISNEIFSWMQQSLEDSLVCFVCVFAWVCVCVHETAQNSKTVFLNASTHTTQEYTLKLITQCITIWLSDMTCKHDFYILHTYTRIRTYASNCSLEPGSSNKYI